MTDCIFLKKRIPLVSSAADLNKVANYTETEIINKIQGKVAVAREKLNICGTRTEIKLDPQLYQV
jgi:hypothetical protein